MPPLDGDDDDDERPYRQIRRIFDSSELPAAGRSLSFERPPGCSCDECPRTACVQVPLGNGGTIHMDFAGTTFQLKSLVVLLPSCVLSKLVPAQEVDDAVLSLSVSATWSGLHLKPATKHQRQGAAPALAAIQDLLLGGAADAASPRPTA